MQIRRLLVLVVLVFGLVGLGACGGSSLPTTISPSDVTSSEAELLLGGPVIAGLQIRTRDSIDDPVWGPLIERTYRESAAKKGVMPDETLRLLRDVGSMDLLFGAVGKDVEQWSVLAILRDLPHAGARLPKIIASEPTTAGNHFLDEGRTLPSGVFAYPVRTAKANGYGFVVGDNLVYAIGHAAAQALKVYETRAIVPRPLAIAKSALVTAWISPEAGRHLCELSDTCKASDLVGGVIAISRSDRGDTLQWSATYQNAAAADKAAADGEKWIHDPPMLLKLLTLSKCPAFRIVGYEPSRSGRTVTGKLTRFGAMVQSLLEDPACKSTRGASGE